MVHSSYFQSIFTEIFYVLENGQNKDFTLYMLWSLLHHLKQRLNLVTTQWTYQSNRALNKRALYHSNTTHHPLMMSQGKTVTHSDLSLALFSADILWRFLVSCNTNITTGHGYKTWIFLPPYGYIWCKWCNPKLDVWSSVFSHKYIYNTAIMVNKNIPMVILAYNNAWLN